MRSFLDDETLEKLRYDLESDLVERKSSAADRSGIRRNICAFANDLAGHSQPGIILIGVRDDGSCAGITVDDQLLRLLAQMKDDGNILPIPSIHVERRVLKDGCEVAVVTVHPASSPPVRYQGRVWVKVGPTVRLASAEEEARLAERRRAHNLPFDMRPASQARMTDLDLGYLEHQYLPQAIAPDVLEANRRPLEQQLRSLRLLVDETPTWGALLGFAIDPQRWRPGAYVQFVRYAGRDVTAPIKDQKELTGRLEDILRRMDELFEINISVRTDVTSAARELRMPDYPLVALQQLGRNAVMHRDYESSNAPVRIYWYEDRVEIQNPGGLFGQVTEKNFGEGVTDYRNPLVAEIMHHLGFAQRFGMGIPLARKALADNGNPPPEFCFETTYTSVTIRAVP